MLLLARVLSPEAAVLYLHAHTHTEEPALRAAKGQPAKLIFTPKHQHCHEDQLYQLPFLPAAPVMPPAPVRQLVYATYRPGVPVCRPMHLLDGACLRGPPASS